ncbi:MAG TPA: hypothetical protein VHV27_12345 [Phenylobacterium sp.]|nr:hypothetical protein [Phenylobacterium sp.]
MKALIAATACAALLCGCSQPKSTPPASSSAPPPKFNTSLPVDELMAHVVDPASFVYWKGAGTEVTAKGARDLAPTTEEGWTALESGAASLIEAGNMLQLPGRPRPPEKDWDAFAQRLTDLAIPAKAAAEKHDEKGVYTYGAKIYQVCTDCHEEYVIQPQLRATGPAPGNPLPDWPADMKAKTAKYAASHGGVASAPDGPKPRPGA